MSRNHTYPAKSEKGDFAPFRLLWKSLGLYYYNARYYNPALGRFIQADSIVPEPGNPQALNRYSYVYNNPLQYIDPSGHFTVKAIVGYLNENPDEAGPTPREWYNDETWWEMLREAEAGDTIALVDDKGRATWYYITGSGEDRIDGIYQLPGPGSPLLGSPPKVSFRDFEEARTSRFGIGGVFSFSQRNEGTQRFPKRAKTQI